MINDHHTRSSLQQMRVDELVHAGRRAGRARSERTPRAWRLAVLRLLARGLRVQRELDLELARAPRR